MKLIEIQIIWKNASDNQLAETFSNFSKSLKSISTKENKFLCAGDLVNRGPESEKVVDYVIKNEELNSGLKKFATTVKPEFFHQSRVEEFFERAQKVNVSKTKEIDIEPVSDENKEIIKRKEFLLMRLY